MEAAMCTLLNRTSATDYFQPKFPDDLVGYFTTAPGKPPQRKAVIV
jgi:hypothetical protein